MRFILKMKSYHKTYEVIVIFVWWSNQRVCVAVSVTAMVKVDNSVDWKSVKHNFQADHLWKVLIITNHWHSELELSQRRTRVQALLNEVV